MYMSVFQEDRPVFINFLKKFMTQRWLITSIYNQTHFILTTAIGGRYDDHVRFTKQRQTKRCNLPRVIKLVNDNTGIRRQALWLLDLCF